MATENGEEMGGVLLRAVTGGGDDTSASSENHNDDIDYKKSAQYWASCEPTVQAMLGGFGRISGIDIAGSQSFLNYLFQLENPPGKERAVDCGAGIGRITKLMLSQRFDKVDLVEQCPKFLEEAQSKLKSCKTVGEFICCGLQDFEPRPATYDVIWCQWVLGHLTDDDLLQYLKRCKIGLKPSGVIVLKENVTRTDEVDVDSDDGSVTRSISLFKSLMEQAGLVIIKERRQVRFPKSLYPVYMYALRPDDDKSPTS